MRYFKDKTNQVHGFDETIEFFTTLIEKAITDGWEELTGSYPLLETLEATQERLSASLTSAINDGAKQWGYDDIVSAISYLTSTVPQYTAEAKALNQWRDEVWAWAIPALKNANAGETAGQFLATMPELPPRP
jgi:hypothetical protein